MRQPSLQNLFHTVADEDTNINEHLIVIKDAYKCITSIGDKHLHISDPIFKIIISSLLPRLWDPFTASYVKDIGEDDPAKIMSSQKFIGLIKEEYTCRVNHSKGMESMNQATASRSLGKLAQWIDTPKRDKGPRPKCQQCKGRNHITENCYHLGKNKCPTCNNFGHAPKDCWFKD